MKTTLITLVTLLSSTVAMAAPQYRCQPLNDDSLAPLVITLTSEAKVQVSSILENHLVGDDTLVKTAAEGTPADFTRFFGVFGCNQGGHGPHCFAIRYETLFISNEILSGAQHGEVSFGSESYSCSHLMGPIEN